MTPRFRRAKPADLPALLEIESQSFAEPHWIGDDFLRYKCVVAEVNDSVVGFLVVRETFAGDDRERAEREILNVAVAPPFRHRGIASSLLRNEIGSGAVYFLEVRESNRAAQALYTKLGFIEIARRAKYYRKPAETAIVMQVK